MFKREPTIPISAVEAIIYATVAAMKAGGDVAIDMMYPLRDADQEDATTIMDTIADDRDFIQTGGAIPEWEEDEAEPEEEDAL